MMHPNLLTILKVSMIENKLIIYKKNYDRKESYYKKNQKYWIRDSFNYKRGLNNLIIRKDSSKINWEINKEEFFNLKWTQKNKF